MRTLWVVMMVSVLAGCSAMEITQIVIDEDPTIAGKPVAYREGFADGCRSGVKEYRGSWSFKGDEFIRDDGRMKTDNDYSLGWQDGARRCLARFGGGGSIFVAPRK